MTSESRNTRDSQFSPALAINVGASTQQAIEICNMQNKDIGLTVSCNTLMKTIAEYTHVDISAVHCRKTGSKDSNSDWAVAHTVFQNSWNGSATRERKLTEEKLSLIVLCRHQFGRMG